jgi:carboxylesterase
MNGTRRRWIILLILGSVLASVFIILTPWNLSNLASHPRPVQNYAEALQRVEILRGQQPPEMNPVCQLQLMTHDKKVDRAIILVHGYTNCPQQFHALGQRFYDAGYNVLIAPLPHHGLANTTTRLRLWYHPSLCHQLLGRDDAPARTNCYGAGARPDATGC